MLVAAHIILSVCDIDSTGRIIAVLMVSGIVCAYLDFLTAETLTLTVPLLLAVCLLARQGAGVRDLSVLSLRSAVAWAAGYAGMFVIKWGLASLVLHGNAMEYVADSAAERVSGLVLDMAYFSFFGPVVKNIGTVLPFSLGTAGTIVGVIILMGCLYFGYVHCRPGARIGVVLLYLGIAIIPLVRFIVLRNHSVLHFFFTCRALFGTIFAICLIMGEALGTGRTRGNAG